MKRMFFFSHIYREINVKYMSSVFFLKFIFHSMNTFSRCFVLFFFCFVFHYSLFMIFVWLSHIFWYAYIRHHIITTVSFSKTKKKKLKRNNHYAIHTMKRNKHYPLRFISKWRTNISTERHLDMIGEQQQQF